jgi:DNA-binding transcriptional ArsR family regulator
MWHTRAVRTTEVLGAIGEPHRRAILDLLLLRDCTVGELADLLQLSQPQASKHLRVLRDVGLVESRVNAQQRMYRVRPEPLRDIDDWLKPYRRFWSRRLDALETHLNERRKRG